MEKYQNKYRIKSHRKPNWDYSADAFYFLTIVTQNRECNLGSIVNYEMLLSDYGKIVETEWFKSFDIRDELMLHEFVLMPNHLHAIVEIYNQNRGADPFAARPSNPPVRLPKSISSFIAGFKSAVNTKIDDYIDENNDKGERPLIATKYNRQNHFFQPNYHDHIIRNDFEYHNISNYIINNPAKWADDRFYG